MYESYGVVVMLDIENLDNACMCVVFYALVRTSLGASHSFVFNLKYIKQ